MENLVWREFDRYKLRKASAHSNLFPYANSAGYEPLKKETMFSSIPMVSGSLQLLGHLVFLFVEEFLHGINFIFSET